MNLLDWATDISPLSISAGWQDNAGSVSVNGVNLTDDFDVALYIKGDIKPATVFSAELLVSYDEIEIHDAGTELVGTEGDDHLVGVGNNTFTGGLGSDLFVVSYGTSVTDVLTANTITDFEVGHDKIGFIGFDGLEDFNAETVEGRAMITQGVSGDDLTVSVDGELVVNLTGLAAELGVGDTVDPGEGLDMLDDFFVSNPGDGEVAAPEVLLGSVQSVDNLTHEAQTVSFEGGATFDNVVVFATPATRNGSHAVAVEFSKVTSTGVTLYLEEPDSYDGKHVEEQVSLVAFEEGTFELADGSLLQVGTAATVKGPTETFQDVTFDVEFDELPVILLQVQTNNGTDWEIVRAQNVTTTGFEFALQEAEDADGRHTSEIVGWAALDASSADGIVDWNGVMGEAFNTGPIVDHTPDEFVFNSDIGTTPLIAASMTTFNGSDTANIRLTSLADDGSAATASFVGSGPIKCLDAGLSS